MRLTIYVYGIVKDQMPNKTHSQVRTISNFVTWLPVQIYFVRANV